MHPRADPYPPHLEPLLLLSNTAQKNHGQWNSPCSSVAERVTRNDEVLGSIPSVGIFLPLFFQ